MFALRHTYTHPHIDIRAIWKNKTSSDGPKFNIKFFEQSEVIVMPSREGGTCAKYRWLYYPTGEKSARIQMYKMFRIHPMAAAKIKGETPSLCLWISAAFQHILCFSSAILVHFSVFRWTVHVFRSLGKMKNVLKFYMLNIKKKWRLRQFSRRVYYARARALSIKTVLNNSHVFSGLCVICIICMLI